LEPAQGQPRGLTPRLEPGGEFLEIDIGLLEVVKTGVRPFDGVAPAFRNQTGTGRKHVSSIVHALDKRQTL
jgi:hypothetical protein